MTPTSLCRFNPPSEDLRGLVMRDNGSGVIAPPVAFHRKIGLGGKKGMEEVGFWDAIAPPGYVAMGCVAHKGTHSPPLTLLC